MEKCSATTATGLRCKRNAKTDGKCTQHAKILTTAVLMCGHRWEGRPDRRCKKHATHGLFCHTHEEVPEEDQCTHTAGPIKCHRRKFHGNPTRCQFHLKQEEARRYRDYRGEHYPTFVRIYERVALAQGLEIGIIYGNAYFRQVVRNALRCVRHKYISPNPNVTDEQIVAMYPIPPPVQPILYRTDLARFANDNQNVHTAAVSEQTNKSIEILMRIPIPATQQTMAEVRNEWTKIYNRVPVDERIYIDMNIWYTQPTCCKENDWLYKNVLDHLWAKIQSEPKKDVQRELIKRLQQECAESFQMCCIGHINRLTNVMVGFDEEFKPQISKGEMLQNKFAEFANIEDEIEKYLQATALLAELNVVGDEAAVWLDALA